MNLLKQENRWGCGFAAFAMLFDLSIKETVDLIGHDGSEIWWPGAEEPLCRRGVHVDELIEAAYGLGYGLIQFEANPLLWDTVLGQPKAVVHSDYLEARLDRIMARGPGLILGQYAPNKWHLCAWDQTHVLDPMEPRRYSFNEVGVSAITIATFWLKVKLRTVHLP